MKKGQDVCFVLLFSFGSERGGGQKVWFPFQRAFLRSGDSFSLDMILEDHCSGFHDNVNARYCV